MSANCSVALYIWNPFPLRLNGTLTGPDSLGAASALAAGRALDAREACLCRIAFAAPHKSNCRGGNPPSQGLFGAAHQWPRATAEGVSIVLINQTVIIAASF